MKTVRIICYFISDVMSIWERIVFPGLMALGYYHIYCMDGWCI